MEDNLKILKVQYLRNCLLGYTQILNLSLHGQTIMFTKKEKDLKISKVKYLCNQEEFRGKLRGNLECGSAQPSLFQEFSQLKQ